MRAEKGDDSPWFLCGGLTDKGIVRRERSRLSCAYETIPERSARPGAWSATVWAGPKRGTSPASWRWRPSAPTWKTCAARTSPERREGSWPLAEDANRVVYHKASTDDACIGMGTTLVGLILQGETLEVVNVGDSRAYLIRPDGIRRITRDHSVVEDLIANGDLTPEQARRHPQKNLITRALGTSPRVKADLFQETVAPGDALLLCSDGLINEVTDQEIQKEVLDGGSPQEICQRLVARTLDHGAPDNVTVVLFQL